MEADTLAKSRELTKVLHHPSIAIICVTTTGKGWKDPIKKYLLTLDLPEDSLEVAKVRK